MKHRHWIFAALVILLAAGALETWRHRLDAQRQEREAHFLSLHFLALEAMGDAGVEPPTLERLLHGPAKDSPLMRPFPDGIIYQVEGSTFTLAEPRARHVSLWKKDRLIASDRQFPCWESTGELAHK